MKTKTFSGNFFQIGEQQGEIYKKQGMQFEKTKMNSKLFQNQLRVYKKFYPELLEEFEGMAKAGNFDLKLLLYDFICGEILLCQRRLNFKSCTMFGIKNKNGIFVGRNYDNLESIGELFGVYKVKNSHRNSFIAVSDMGIGSEDVNLKNLVYGADDGINDKGLFIGITSASNNKINYGLSQVHILKLILETCNTLKDAIKVFQEVPVGVPKNYFVADKNGDMAVIQHTSKKFKIIHPRDNVLIQTNHYTDFELSKEDRVLDENPTHNTFLRYYETLQKINLGRENFKFQDIIKILGNKKSYVCQNKPRSKTVWSLALDMKKQNYKLYWDLFRKRKEKILKI